ncbi:MAG: hypothetical protein JWO73_314 [Candidatus Taylorbacteria bacterium]|nr:hypothetical protein [Candidatus Taylorbacteria bacterium]
MKHAIRQRFPKKAASVSIPTQEDILKEPLFRRATAGFVRQHGGRFAQEFLAHAEKLGLVSEKSRFMCQRSRFVEGAYPSSPDWHFDVIPGLPSSIEEHVTNPIVSAILCACSPDRVSTTEFISEGTVIIDDGSNERQHYKGGEYLHGTGGKVNFFHRQIEDAISRGEISAQSLEPNHIYVYDSSSLHRASKFTVSGGYRLIIRITNAPDGFMQEIPINDQILTPERDQYIVFVDGSSEVFEKRFIS